jgi:hypothetical protein
MHLIMVETLGTVHTDGHGLLRGRWWPVGPNLVSGQRAAPVPQIMDLRVYTGALSCTIYIWRLMYIFRPHAALSAFLYSIHTHTHMFRPNWPSSSVQMGFALYSYSELLLARFLCDCSVQSCNVFRHVHLFRLLVGKLEGSH